MNTLRLDIINLHAPYRVKQREDKPQDYYFRTDYGVEYDISLEEDLLYITETGDEKQRFRNRLFVRWFNTYEHRDQYYIQTAEGIMEGQMNFAAIISRLTCPHLRQAIDEFNETISLLFDKIK